MPAYVIDKLDVILCIAMMTIKTSRITLNGQSCVLWSSIDEIFHSKTLIKPRFKHNKRLQHQNQNQNILTIKTGNSNKKLKHPGWVCLTYHLASSPLALPHQGLYNSNNRYLGLIAVDIFGELNKGINIRDTRRIHIKKRRERILFAHKFTIVHYCLQLC